MKEQQKYNNNNNNLEEEKIHLTEISEMKYWIQYNW